MGFLRYFDYQNYIQNANLTQILASNDAIRVSVEQAAQAEMISYLTDKYDCDVVFAPTNNFSLTAKFKANSLVQITADAYLTTTIYTHIGIDYVLQSGKIYVLKTSGATSTFDPSKWTLVGNQYDLFYINYPYLPFDLNKYYIVGNIIFHKNKVYKAILPSLIQDHADKLQAGEYSNVVPNNIFPDDPINGVKYWGIGIDYTVTGLGVIDNPSVWTAINYSINSFVNFSGMIWQALVNVLSTDIPGQDITKWQPITWISGDNRNAQLVMYMIRILIYHVSSRLSPNNTPIEIEKRYMGMAEDRIKYKGKIIYPTYCALGWLQECAQVGDTTVDLIEKQPAQGSRISGGSSIKQINDY
jgi:hypothetical protein